MHSDIIRQIVFSVIDQRPRARIAESLNKAGHRTTRDKPWSDVAVSREIKRYRDLGALDGAVTNPTHQFFLRALTHLPPATRQTYLLKGILFCSQGHPMYVHDPKSKNYSCKPCKISVPRDDVEGLTLDYLASLLNWLRASLSYP